MIGMMKGGKRLLVVPASLAFGTEVSEGRVMGEGQGWKGRGGELGEVTMGIFSCHSSDSSTDHYTDCNTLFPVLYSITYCEAFAK